MLCFKRSKVILLLICFFVYSNAHAQTKETVDKKLSTITQSLGQSDLPEEEKKQVQEHLDHAKTALKNSSDFEAQRENYGQTATKVAQKLAELQQEQKKLSRVSPVDYSEVSGEQLANQLTLLQSNQANLLSQFDDFQQQKTTLSQRPVAIGEELNATKNELETTVSVLQNKSVQGEKLSEKSKQVALQAKAISLRSQITLLEQEVSTIPARQSLVNKQLTLLNAQIEAGEQQIKEIQSLIEKKRAGGADNAIKMAERDVQASGDDTALLEIAKDNLSLANALQNIVLDSPSIDENTTRLRQQQKNLKQSSETVSRILATGQITDELGILLHRLRSGLPHESPLQKRLNVIEEHIVQHQLNLILWQDKLHILNSERASGQLQSSPEGQVLTVSHLNDKQTKLLDQLIAAANEQLEKLTDEKLMIIDVKSSTSDLKDLLDRRLIWLPSYTQLTDNILSNLMASADWYMDASAWMQVGRSIAVGTKKNVLLSTIVAAVFILLLLVKNPLKRSLKLLSTNIGNVGKDTHWATPVALIETIILALPLPLGIAALAGLIAVGSADDTFPRAIATALATVSSLSLTLLFFRSMCRQNGMFVAHFGWSDRARKSLGLLLTWFAWYQGLATFVFASAIASNQLALRYGIAIVAFILMSVGIAIFSFHFFKPKSGIAINISPENPHSRIVKIAFPIMVIAPLLIGFLPLIGFFDTAMELLSKLFSSGVVLIFMAIVYGVALRVLVVAYRRYMLRKVKQYRAKQEEQRYIQEQQDASGEAVPEIRTEPLPDEETAIKRMRSNTMGLCSILFLAGLWFIWLPLLPALGIVDEIVLWQKSLTIEGIQVSENVTLWNIIVAILFLLGGLIAARNSRGMLEISFFDKVSLDAGARYAAVTIFGYVIFGTGLVLGLSQLGIDWSKLQWIVAALGVGLGFGLQEIVANFVSGLIILFERPVRVGDTVTIGNLSGTVSNIKIRATTITDFENREVLLPNKSIITENVTNWTLHDPVTRLLLTIGVAYGSDTRRVKEVLSQVLESHPDILEQPACSVFFVNHGESSLDFELRFFVDSPSKRLPVIHEINTLINEALNENGFEIPFPQRDIHIIGANQSLLSQPDNTKKSDKVE